MKRARMIVVITTFLMILNIVVSERAFLFENNNYEPENLLRLHVIANSNSLEDQALKRKIRNKVIEYTEQFFDNVENITEASKIMTARREDLAAIIRKEILTTGQDYKISIRIRRKYFPKRSYGSITLGAGSYQAVEVILGKGQGENWWCVLFPPLCFVDSIDSIDKETEEKMVAQIHQEVDKEIKIKFKFKLLEYLKGKPEFIEKSLKLAKVFPFYN